MTTRPRLHALRALCLALLAASIAASAPAAAVAATQAPTRPAVSPARPTVAALRIPGDPRFVAIARDVLLVQTDASPDFAAQAGLVDDAIRVPSFEPGHVAVLVARLDADLAALEALPWRRWSVDRQIDVRWVHANVERMRRELLVERPHAHRPAAWLEAVVNTLIAIVTYAPARTDAVDVIAARLPAVVDEMERFCQPTQADAETAIGLVDGLSAMLRTRPASAPALDALRRYRERLVPIAAGPASFSVIGAENYAWRLRRANLLPWDPQTLLAMAERRVVAIDAELAALPAPVAPALTPALEDAAVRLDQASLLALYDRIQTENRAAIERAGFVGIPRGVGPVRARVTPDALVPLSGDGGSMNAPPPDVDDATGWWNVEHFDPAMPLAERERTVRDAALFRESGMGPYAVHEGMPGHHLQLSIARLLKNPLRNLFMDPVQVEGWALYAEGEMWEQGGLGASPAAHRHVLDSWRFRARRVVYDVRIETGAWTLQQGADWRDEAEPGKGRLDPEIRRSVNWPAQLVCYFAGKEQILALKADVKKKRGARFSERRFHDELLALGSVPIVFARAKLLGEPVPGF